MNSRITCIGLRAFSSVFPITHLFYISAILALAGLCGQACGDVILTNLPGSGSYTGGEVGISTSTWEAVGLTTGSSAVTFSSMSGYFFSGVSGGTIEGGIFSDNSGAPGSLQAAFTSVTVTGDTGTNEYTLNTASSYTLQADTNYWFVLHDAAAFGWERDTASSDVGTVPTAEGGYTFNGYTNSTNTGSTWSTPSTSTGNYTVSIVASAVPEPASLSLFAVAAGVLLARRRPRGMRLSAGK